MNRYRTPVLAAAACAAAISPPTRNPASLSPRGGATLPPRGSPPGACKVVLRKSAVP